MKKFFGTTILLCIVCLFTWLFIAFYVELAPVKKIVVQNGKNSGQSEVESEIKTDTTAIKNVIKNEAAFLGTVLKNAQNSTAETETTGSSSSSSSGGSVTPPPATKVTPPPPTTSSCPVSTQSCVPCSTVRGATNYYSDCRAAVGKTTGYRGWSCQNNNPGNILYTTQKLDMITSFGGSAPCGKVTGTNGYTYMIFSTYSAGFNSTGAYIKAINAGKHSAYTGCGANCTLDFFLRKWVGCTTDVTVYCDYSSDISAALNVNGTQVTLNAIVTTRLNDLINAIRYREGWFTY